MRMWSSRRPVRKRHKMAQDGTSCLDSAASALGPGASLERTCEREMREAGNVGNARERLWLRRRVPVQCRTLAMPNGQRP